MYAIENLRKGLGGVVSDTLRSSAATDKRNSRRIGVSALLVTFCNVRDKAKPVIATVDLKRRDPQPRWLTPGTVRFLHGATGLCHWRDLVCVVHQGGPRRPPGFLLLDPRADLEAVSEGTLSSTAHFGPHSVCAAGEDLYIVAAGQDSIYRAKFDAEARYWSVRRHWTYPSSTGGSDENHINAIESINGKLCVSGFGKKDGDFWISAKEGFVCDTDSNVDLMQGVYQPHSLLHDAQTIWTCESWRKKVISDTGAQYKLPVSTGYVRGLAIGDEYLYAGVGKVRKASASAGKLAAKNMDQYEGECCIFEVSKCSGQARKLIDFSSLRNEIYELMLI